MREILFRGKRDYNGEWVEGSLLVWPDGSAEMCHSNPNDGDELLKVIVRPETVGQYTGLIDKNGKKIFEGDVVRIRGDQSNADWKNVDYSALIAFLDGGFCALDGTVEEHGFRRYALARMDFDIEVIGNIHDNPELLEATE